MGNGLRDVLRVVGPLGDDAGRERFRQFLRETAPEVERLRDYVQECLADQRYERYLQDLINYIGHLLEFEVTYGRYQDDVDGVWRSPSGLHIVIKIKANGVAAMTTAKLVQDINYLISDNRIPSFCQAVGLYVVGGSAVELRQLADRIVAEKKTDLLRVISFDSLLLLAETMAEYDISHEETLTAIVLPGPGGGAIVDVASLPSILQYRDLD